MDSGMTCGQNHNGHWKYNFVEYIISKMNGTETLEVIGQTASYELGYLCLTWVWIFQVHENAYLSDFHHCFSMPSNASGQSGYESLLFWIIFSKLELKCIIIGLLPIILSSWSSDNLIYYCT